MSERKSKGWSRFWGDTSGNTFMMSAIALIPLVAMIGGGLDMSIAYMARGKLQNACDAAALAARQSMDGSTWDNASKQEAQRFFNFNFPDGTLGTQSVSFSIAPNEADDNELVGSASVKVPTALMQVFGYDNIDVSVDCNAKRDLGHNDVVLVLDVTGSMNYAPSSGGGTKIGRLRTGAMGLYRALDQDNDSITRYGIVPYSHTVNVARSLKNKDILREQPYVEEYGCDRRGRNCSYRTKIVHINQSSWNNGQNGGGAASGNTEAFRTSGDGCIEERPSVGNSMSPFEINDTVSRADVDTQAGNAGNQEELQFGRYDPWAQDGEEQSGCPSEATTLRPYASESSFQSAINAATARVTGGTYHDIGLLWGARFISRTGYFDSNNPTEWEGIPIRQHIVFMTDGKLDTDDLTGWDLYSAYGLQRYQDRVQGSSSLRARHISRFRTACNVAKSMGVTIWVIALDVTDTEDIEPCATSSAHFYTSDGSDLEDVFEKIGQGIGNLRLTR